MKKMIKSKLMQWLDAVPREELEVETQRVLRKDVQLRSCQEKLYAARRATESVKAVVQPHLTGRTYGAKLDSGRVVVQVHATQDAKINALYVADAAKHVATIMCSQLPKKIEKVKAELHKLEQLT